MSTEYRSEVTFDSFEGNPLFIDQAQQGVSKFIILILKKLFIGLKKNSLRRYIELMHWLLSSCLLY